MIHLNEMENPKEYLARILSRKWILLPKKYLSVLKEDNKFSTSKKKLSY